MHIPCVNCREQKSGRSKNLHEIKRGNTVVKIYSRSIEKRGKTYPLHTLAYYEAGQRVMRSFADLGEAKQEADKAADRLEKGERDVLKLTNSDQSAFALAANKLKPFGIPLLSAVEEYVQVLKILNGVGTPIGAAKEYADRHRNQLPDKPIAELVEQFIKDREDPSERYVETLHSRLDRFTAHFTGHFKKLSAITSDDINTWLRGLGVARATRRNILTDLRTFFTYARGLGYLPKGEPTAPDEIKVRRAKTGTIETLTPEELSKLLTAADTDERKIYFVLAAFTGLRSEELNRLEWSDVKLARGHIELGADKAKTTARRIIPICDSLAAWLAPHVHKKGRIFTSPRAPERMTWWARKKLGTWPHNALRHSFISYRVAVTQDLPRTALESGNSVQMIQKHYRDLKTEADGKAWFAIMPPEQPSNVVSMKGKAA